MLLFPLKSPRNHPSLSAFYRGWFRSPRRSFCGAIHLPLLPENFSLSSSIFTALQTFFHTFNPRSGRENSEYVQDDSSKCDLKPSPQSNSHFLRKSRLYDISYEYRLEMGSMDGTVYVGASEASSGGRKRSQRYWAQIFNIASKFRENQRKSLFGKTPIISPSSGLQLIPRIRNLMF